MHCRMFLRLVTARGSHHPARLPGDTQPARRTAASGSRTVPRRVPLRGARFGHSGSDGRMAHLRLARMGGI
eukprot:619069-Hanusia_phi.AAC.1